MNTSASDLPTAIRPKKKAGMESFLNLSLLATGVGLLLVLQLPIFQGGLFTAQTYRDFGKVRSGKTLQAEFVLTNLHPWPVVVQQIAGDCGCTNALPQEKSLPLRLLPLQSLPVNVSINTYGREGDVTRTVTITTTDQRPQHVEETYLYLHAYLLRN